MKVDFLEFISEKLRPILRKFLINNYNIQQSQGTLI